MNWIHRRIIQALVLTIAVCCAAEKPDSLIKKAAAGDSAGVEAMLADGTAIDHQDGKGLTALMAACRGGYPETVRTLLSKGANWKLTSKTGLTAVHYAAASKKPEVLAPLIDAGVDFNIRGGSDLTTGATPLIFAAASGSAPMIQALISAGADVKAADDRGLNALSYVSALTWDSSTKKHEMSTLKHPDCVEALVKAGADPWISAVYANPRLDDWRPTTVALISVADNRPAKNESAAVLDKLTTEVEKHLSKDMRYHSLTLSDVRQKLLADGLAPDQAARPDRQQACKAVPADAVLEVNIEESASKNIVVMKAKGMTLDVLLTSCRTGNLLWKRRDIYSVSLGFLAGAFIKDTELIAAMALSFPAFNADKAGPEVVKKPEPPAPPPAVAMPPAAAPAAATATVNIGSEPSGADIEVDGEFIGNAPTTIKLEAGAHTLVLKKGGLTWTRKLTLIPGSSINVSATLESNQK